MWKSHVRLHDGELKVLRMGRGSVGRAGTRHADTKLWFLGTSRNVILVHLRSALTTAFSLATNSYRFRLRRFEIGGVDYGVKNGEVADVEQVRFSCVTCVEREDGD